MMKIIFSIAVLMFCCVGGMIAQFEGEIGMKLTTTEDGKQRDMVFTMFIKNNMLASTFEGVDKEDRSGRIIFRGDKKVLWVVTDEDKTYLEMAMKDRSGEKPGKQSDEKKSKMNIRKTGKKQTILGYPCDEWIAEDKDQASTIWGTSKLGNLYDGIAKSFSEMGGARAKDGISQWSQLADMKIFPLKMETTKKGKVTERQEVTKIEAKPLAGSTFEPPEGYEKK